jgi:ABC-2 type transport system ATP-binding protein
MATMIETMTEERARRRTDDGAAFAVRIRELTKRFKDGTVANDRICFDVRCSEVLSILGPNGAGKTTLLRQLSTELRPTSGTIEIFGLDAISSPQAVKSLMGIVPQEAGLFDALRVAEHLTLFARLKGQGTGEAQRTALELARKLDLEREMTKRVGTLSGGQKRRLLIGLAFIGKPPLLLLDEPTTGLDPDSRRVVWRAIKEAQAEGATVILSTHYMEEAEHLSDRIAIICEGRLAAFGTLADLSERVTQSYRVSYRDPRDAQRSCIRHFATLSDAQAHVTRLRLNEYQIARASLEDIYFQITGKPFISADGESYVERR